MGAKANDREAFQDIAKVLKGVSPRMRPLLRAAHEQRFRVSKTNGGHVRVASRRRAVVGERVRGGVVIVPATPSDYRSLGNTRAALRRLGVQLP